jgi:hypothetical protein
MPSEGQDIIYTLLKKIQMNVHCKFNIHILIFNDQNVNITIIITYNYYYYSHIINIKNNIILLNECFDRSIMTYKVNLLFF